MKIRTSLLFTPLIVLIVYSSCSKTSIDAELSKSIHTAKSLDANLNLESTSQSILYDLNNMTDRFVFDKEEGFSPNERHNRYQGASIPNSSSFEQVFIRKDTTFLSVEIGSIAGNSVSQSDFEELFLAGDVGFDSVSNRRVIIEWNQKGELFSSDGGPQLGSEFVIEEVEVLNQSKRVKLVARFKCILYPVDGSSTSNDKIIERGNFVGYFSAN